MPANTEAYIGLLIQVPLVGIFIYFTLRIISIFLDSLEKRDLQWQVFLREQRDATNAVVARLAEELKTISQDVSRLTELITMHDQLVREAMAAIRERQLK